jgi:hypothetical protein
MTTATETKTNMWDQTTELAKQHDQNAGVWLKLANDGDRAVVVFLGEPYPREVVFVDNKYQPFTEEHKAEGLKPTLRVALNVALYESKEMKVIEQGVVFFKQLLQMRAKRPLEDWAFEVERHGAPKDPKTTYSILPEQKLTDQERAEFQVLELRDLEKLYEEGGDDEAGEEVGSYDRKGAGVVDPKRSQAMVRSLKALPKEAVDRFLHKFSISRIKDLPATQEEKALAFIEVLSAELKGADDDVGIDPFA